MKVRLRYEIDKYWFSSQHSASCWYFRPVALWMLLSTEHLRGKEKVFAANDQMTWNAMIFQRYTSIKAEVFLETSWLTGAWWKLISCNNVCEAVFVSSQQGYRHPNPPLPPSLVLIFPVLAVTFMSGRFLYSNTHSRPDLAADAVRITPLFSRCN